jgi:heme/copper-type cytochrome/quinol oxidase subunit 1
VPSLSVWSIRAALTWLAIGALTGALILARVPLGHPEWGSWIPAHAEIMLMGWMVQLAFGVAHWILPRQPAAPDGGRGFVAPVVVVVVLLNVGVVLVVAGELLVGRSLETVAALGFALQGIPRIRAAGWGATGKGGDLVRLKRKVEQL